MCSSANFVSRDRERSGGENVLIFSNGGAEHFISCMSPDTTANERAIAREAEKCIDERIRQVICAHTALTTSSTGK